MKIRSLILASLLCLPLGAGGEILPGFRLEKLPKTEGFVTSIAIDAAGTLYHAAQTGEIYRLEGSVFREIAVVPTHGEGNAGLIGLAVLDEEHLVVHYVDEEMIADVIATVAVSNGEVTPLARFVCSASGSCSSEHHGGDLIVAPDGAIYFAIGDYGAYAPSQDPVSPGGKIHRVLRDGSSSVFATGFRNPFDLAWHPLLERIVMTDNGPEKGDELNLVAEGENHGWPRVWGEMEPLPGMSSPAYVFPSTVAPTGITLVTALPPLRDHSVLVGGFVTKALHYFPSVEGEVVGPPITLFKNEIGPVIDVAQAPDGKLYVAGASAIYRLHVPAPGDANGDGVIDDRDFEAIALEILDGDGDSTLEAHKGTFAGSWGADVNMDGVIDARDMIALARKLGRLRPARP